MKAQKSLPAIFVDLDGVLVNTIEETLTELYKLFNAIVAPEDVIDFDIGKSLSGRFPLPPAKLNQLLLRLWEHTDIFARAKPYWGLLLQLKKFVKAGGIVFPITARKSHGPIKHMTLDWLQLWLPYARDVIFSPNKSVVICKHMERHFAEHVWFIDDYHATCLQVHEATGSSTYKNDLTIYMPERPWNKHLFGKPIAKRYVEQDIEELLVGIR